jgi:DNA-binding NarL/FixJ family response regulator
MRHRDLPSFTVAGPFHSTRKAGARAGAHPGAKIIFTSSYTDHRAVQKWIDRGCRFLQKPYTPAELVLAVHESFGKK